jgi:hypothetical protein
MEILVTYSEQTHAPSLTELQLQSKNPHIHSSIFLIAHASPSTSSNSPHSSNLPMSSHLTNSLQARALVHLLTAVRSVDMYDFSEFNIMSGDERANGSEFRRDFCTISEAA